MTMGERKATEEKSNVGLHEAINNCIRMRSDLYQMQDLSHSRVSRALDAVSDLLDDLLAMQRNPDESYSDRRPLTSKAEPVGAHKVYSGR